MLQLFCFVVVVVFGGEGGEGKRERESWSTMAILKGEGFTGYGKRGIPLRH